MALQKYANCPLPSSPSTPFSTLSGAITDIATTLTVASATPFPTTPQFTIAIEDELLLVTGVAGAVFTVTRGVEGTAAAAHADTTGVFAPLTAASLALLPVSISETGISYGTSADTVLARTGAGTMKLTSASASASLGVANGSNLEYGAIGWDGSNTFRLGTQGAVNGGTARDVLIGSALGASNGIYFATEETSRWQITNTGYIRPFATATYDLGDSTHVVRAAYLGKIGNLTSNGLVTTSAGDGTLGITALGTGVATFLTTPTSANLAAALTNETGTGVAVFNDTPTLLTPTIASFTNATHTHADAAGGGTLSAAVIAAGTLAAARGGTGVSNTGTITLGGNLTTSGAFATTLTVTNTTGVTLPTTGTLATLAGSEELTNKTLNGNTFTAGTYTLTGAASKVLTFNHSLTLAGTDSTTMTFPTTSATIARTDAAQTFTGSQTIAALVGPVTITEAVGSSGLTITGATQVASFPALTITQTANNAAIAFTAIKLNVTQTAALSYTFLDLQRGGVSQISMDSFGGITATGYTDARLTTGQSGQVTVKVGVGLNFPVSGSTLNAVLYGLTGGVLEQRNAANAQTYNLYSTWTSATSNEYANLLWSSSVFHIGTNKGSGGGTARVMQLDYGGTTTSAMTIPITSGNIVFGGGVQLSNAAVTGLAAGVLAASTNASIVLYDSGGQAYRVPCII